MEQKSFRINTKIGSDTNIKIQLKEKYNTLDILSLKIADRDIYQTTSSDWGIVIGRVNGNGSVGIPNTKVSIFIPIDDVDANNPEILSVYPFLNVEDTTRDGTRYNLLPRLQGLDRLSGWVSNIFKIGYKPKTAVGTFPSKDDLLSNPTILKVYEKYYRYTTTTNQSGDFMLFGVPIGQQTIHIDTDLTDIGQFSMTPLVLQKKANKDVSLFSEDGNDIVKSSDLSTLPNIETQNQVINVIPFWGDKTAQEIGITRKDFKLKAELIPNFTVIGSAFTMPEKSYWGDRVVFRLYLGFSALCFRILGRTIKIRGVIPIIKLDAFKFEENTINGGIRDNEPFQIIFLSDFKSVCSSDVSNEIRCSRGTEVTSNLEAINHRNGDINIDVIKYSTDGELTGGEVLSRDIDKFSLVGNNDKIYFNENGQFGITLFCNRDKKITDELGNFVTSDNNDGVFTSFVGYFIIDCIANIEGSSTNFVSGRTRMKIPQSSTIQSGAGTRNTEWIRKTYKFGFGEIYSVAQLFYVKDVSTTGACIDTNARPFGDYVGVITNADEVGIICNDNYTNLSNGGNTTGNNVFTNQWLNFCLYFPQFIYKNRKKKNKSQVCNILLSKSLIYDNSVPLGGGLVNSKFFMDGDKFRTDFVKIPKEDFINILSEKCDKNAKGFTSADFLIQNTDITKPIKPLIGNYKFINHQMPNNGFNNPNSIKYFYRGLKRADCFIFAINKGIIQ